MLKNLQTRGNGEFSYPNYGLEILKTERRKGQAPKKEQERSYEEWISRDYFV